jgi:hypothetical protein
VRFEGNEPQRDAIYRCQTCRLELIADLTARKMVVAPLPTREPERGVKRDPERAS